MPSPALLIAAPRSGSGKTTLTLGLLAAFAKNGIAVAPAKSGPDYIDLALHARVAGRGAVNLDAWAMAPAALARRARAHAQAADLLLVEGAMGLFDGAMDGTGSSADLATALGAPVMLVIDCDRQSQSIAALVHGFATFRQNLEIGGVILNRVASARHRTMLEAALAPLGIPVFGALMRTDAVTLPERHLGLVLPGEIEAFDTRIAALGALVADAVDLDAVRALAAPLASGEQDAPRLAPLGQRIAVASDAAFDFLYPHLLADWREVGAEIVTFSPLADEAPDPAADAVFLPGGYPELHGARLAAATQFKDGLAAAAARDARIYGECGGYMVLGRTLVDRDGQGHAMAGLLPHVTRIDRPRRVLGYRKLAHAADLPWPKTLRGHEFHYSSAEGETGPSLFAATDALGGAQATMGMAHGRVMGSYAHVIDIGPDIGPDAAP